MATPKAKKPSYSTKQFFLDDYPRTLFPLSTNKIIIENGEDKIVQYIDECNSGTRSFLPQYRVYASKDPTHLRRTVKLDPIAEYFIYDIVYKNRSLFKKPHNTDKCHYGYRFKDGIPSLPSEDFSKFKFDVWAESFLKNYFIGFDVSTYFNCLYHHDLEAWLAALGASNDDVKLFSKFLREINSGRSVDCLPHGLYPTKMIGNDFLRFIEESKLLNSEKIHRFMDDIYIFSDNKEQTISDFNTIQRLLGLKGLSINSAKTTTLKPKTEQNEENISEIKKRLLKKRKAMLAKNLYDDYETDEKIDEKTPISEEELEFINTILKSGDLEEDDAELVLTTMRTHTSDVLDSLPGIVSRFPHLAKNIYRFCARVKDKNFVANLVQNQLKNKTLQEYQLFWFGMMVESYLLGTDNAGDLMVELISHPNATDISKAKILEIPELRYGIPEIRQTHLSSGRSDWLSWSSAVGSRSIKPAARNYQLSYFMKSSPMNQLIGDVIKNLT